MKLREVRLDDAATLCDIYNHYIEHTIITFEEQPLAVETFARRIREVTETYPWLVLEESCGKLLGYAYARAWGSRSAFRYTVESSIYLSPDAPRGQGLGTHLYGCLLSRLAHEGFHQVIAAITLPNDASMGLHAHFGFVKAGHFHEVGFKFGRWIDVAYLELRLEKPLDSV